MKIGDFFKSAPNARPVNPRVFELALNSRESILPGGTVNPTGKLIQGRGKVCFVFMGGSDAQVSRIDARISLSDRFKDDKGRPRDVDGVDLNVETTWQELWRVIHEWDE